MHAPPPPRRQRRPRLFSTRPRSRRFKAVAEQRADQPAPRVELGNLYFDAERYDDAIKWYSEALKLSPKDVDVSTDLGVSYYYTNQPDRALAQFDESLKIDPKHAKTLLNVGDRQGVRQAGSRRRRGGLAAGASSWRPTGAEGQAAKRALDSLRVGASAGRRARASRVPDAPRSSSCSLLLSFSLRAVLRLCGRRAGGCPRPLAGSRARRAPAGRADGARSGLRHLRRPDARSRCSAAASVSTSARRLPRQVSRAQTA